MSLILGVHFAKKLFLISDTRATIEYSDERKEFRDDLLKVFNINRRITALAAGKAAPAAFILKRLAKIVGEKGSLDDVKKTIESQLKTIITEYVNTTGKYGDVALIIAGYNPQKFKQIESSSLGVAMSADLKTNGNRGLPQSIDNDIKNSLMKAILKKGTLNQGDIVQLENTIDSGIISVRIDVRNNKFSLEEAACYKSVIFHPKQGLITIDVPPELISQIEFGYKDSTDWQDILYHDAEKLMSYVNKQMVNYKFDSVGGNIFIGLATPDDYFCFPTGDIGEIRDGKVVITGSIYVDENREICYKLEDGTSGKYRFLKDLDDSGLELLSL